MIGDALTMRPRFVVDLASGWGELRFSPNPSLGEFLEAAADVGFITYMSLIDFFTPAFISPSSVKYMAICSSASISVYTLTMSAELQPTIS